MPRHHPQLTTTTQLTTDLSTSFVAHAERQPDAPALVWHDEEISYARLHELAERSGARIAALGLGEREPVGVVAKKSPSAVALILGCLMDRRPFLLPPPGLPRRSLAAALAQAGCRQVLTPDGPRQSAGGRRAQGSWAPAPAPTDEADVSFMFTTSGSTGVPKIVPLTAGGVNRFTDWVVGAFGMRPGKTALNYAPLNFVVSLLDLWAPLKCGARAVLADSDLSTNPGYLVGLLRRHEVNLVQAVPMFYRLLLDATQGEPHQFDTVEHVISTGDSITPRRLTDAGRLFAKARLHNGYGCTETLTSFFNEVTTELPGPTVPLGRPLPGVHTLVVDDAGGVVDGAGLGELYVATPFQTAGYLDRSLNAARFVSHPQGTDGVTYFRTGDLVERDADGTLTLVGRNDFEVKVRGVRINAQEVERALAEHDDVVEAAVVALPDPVAGRLLHAMVRRRTASRLNSLVLRQHGALRLPAAAIPATIRFVDEPLPTTSSGKLDRRAVERALADGQATRGGG
ncbi:MAG: AMP-binding protein [Acidimicrobiales bacterium]